MRASIAAMAALVGGLLFLPAIQGPASSAPINLKSFGRISGSIILVGGMGGGNGPAFSGGGGHIGGMSGPRGGGGNYVSRGGGGNFVTQRPRQ